MRVLVVGSLPPPDGDRARALRSEVARLLGEGHTVEVVAPNPLATAHRYLGPAGIVGCIRLATMAGGYDAVVVQVEPGLPVRARAGRLERALSWFSFSFALRRAHNVEIRLECEADLPGGPGGRAALQAWRSADRIVVGGEDQRSGFLLAVGRAGDRSVVISPPVQPLDTDEVGGWGEGADASAENVLELVRSRAARERRNLAEARSARVVGWDRLATPGIAMVAGSSSNADVPSPRGLSGLARSALALADRRPMLRPATTFLRAARRSAYAVLRPARSD
jgi:hypothetical protein